MLLATIATFAVILAGLVLVHEAGHFFAARIFGIRADEFGFGFPPRLFGAQKLKNGKWKFLGARSEGDPEGGTIYSLNWFPLGGFVKIKGESGENQNDSDSFAARPVWQRGIVLAAGVTMNIVLAFVLLSILLTIGFSQPVNEDVINDIRKNGAIIRDYKIQVEEIQKDSPAEKSLKNSDIIVSVDGKIVESYEKFREYINTHRDGVIVGYKRGEDILESFIVPKMITEENRAVIGVSLRETAVISYPWYKAIPEGFKATFSLIKTILQKLYEIIQNIISGHKSDLEVSGIIGIAVYTGKAVKTGISDVLWLTILMSLNLAILNFIPIPALDGGRFLFLVIEKIRGKAIHPKIENISHLTGFILLITLMIVITYLDIMRWGGDIVRVFKGAFGW